MLVNELVGGCNLESMLMVDRDLFANMVVPDGVEKGAVIAAIRRSHGLAPLYHPDPFWMKQELYWWSRENLPIWKKLFATTQLDYNPIWNTDVTEKTRDTTETTRDTSEQNTAHSNGGAQDQKQHADDRHIMETTGNLYHEHTKGDGYTTDNTAGHEQTIGTADGKEHGFAHTQTTSNEVRDTEGTLDRDTTGTLDRDTTGTLDRDTTGTRLTTHDETMTDGVKTTKQSTTDVEGKVSAENEASYQPFDTTHTDYDEKGTSDETRKTDWTENENTTGTQDDKMTGTQDDKTTGTQDDRTTEHMTDDIKTTSDTETKQDTQNLTKGARDTIDRAHGTHGDTGSTDGHGHTERQNGERGTAHDTAVNTHDEHAQSLTTEKQNETTVTTHEWSRSGNIGVTTTQQMIAAERKSVMFNIYQVIADSFHRTFCLDVY